MRFEWSVGAPESHQVPRQIARLLLDKGHAKNAAEAEEKHNRLFLFVLKRLTEKGVKRLSADQCAEQLALPPLSEEDQATLENVVVRLRALESRVGALEQGLQRTTETLDQHLQQHFAKQAGVEPRLDYGTATPIIDVQPLSRTAECLIEWRSS